MAKPWIGRRFLARALRVDDAKASGEEVGVADFKQAHNGGRWLIKALGGGSGVQTPNWHQPAKVRTEILRGAGEGGWKGKMERGRRWREERRKTMDTCSNHKSRDDERTMRVVDLGGHLTGELQSNGITECQKASEDTRIPSLSHRGNHDIVLRVRVNDAVKDEY